LFLTCIAASTVNAQAVIIKDDNWIFWTPDGLLYSYDSHQVTTQAGTINIRINTQFPLTHPLIVEAIKNGSYVLPGYVETPIGWIEGTATIFPNGRVKFNVHYQP